jgi:hypothetical protein
MPRLRLTAIKGRSPADTIMTMIINFGNSPTVTDSAEPIPIEGMPCT